MLCLLPNALDIHRDLESVLDIHDTLSFLPLKHHGDSYLNLYISEDHEIDISYIIYAVLYKLYLPRDSISRDVGN